MTRALAPRFTFGGSERSALQAALLRVRSNPYTHYAKFKTEISELAASSAVPARLREVCRETPSSPRPWCLLRNAPNDIERPVFDFADPVCAKRRTKRTFAAEGMLELVAQLLDTELITYANDNDGDFFHDVYPMESLQHSQSQKSLVSLGFHNDSANHFARPDWLHLLCMRNPPANRVLNTFVVNAEVVAALDEETTALLRRPEYDTPYDDLTVHGDDGRRLGDAPSHPVLEGAERLVYFEGRTRARSEAGQRALTGLRDALHELAYAQVLEPDDLMTIENNRMLHGRLVESIADPEGHRTRWLVKAYSVTSLARFEGHFLPGQFGIVEG